MLTAGREIRGHMTDPVSSDLSDLYDENGFLPDRGNLSLTGIEPALKA